MNNLKDMMCLDIFLQQLNEEELKAIKPMMSDAKTEMHPLLSWDIASMGEYETANYRDIQKLRQLMETHGWHLDLNSVSEKQFDALVLTNVNQRIKWVSHGFKKMTGYSPSHALHKKPSFLQGKNSSVQTRREIKHAIRQRIHFETSIINYRKDGSEYNCHIEVIPLYTKNNKLTHFLAIEKEVD